jgi:hypothetical protein
MSLGAIGSPKSGITDVVNTCFPLPEEGGCEKAGF